MKTIAYKSGYKYQLSEDYSQVAIGIKPEEDANLSYVELNTNGDLFIRAGYAWDGPSGPTIDTKNFMRGSLVHDALYQLMREGLLSQSKFRNKADRLLRIMCREDGMSRIRASWVYYGVKWFAESASDAKQKRKVAYAPAKPSEKHLA